MDNWIASAWPILVSAALKSTLVLGAAWFLAILLRGRSAAARHVMWTACAAALLALPLLSIALPARHLRLANAVLPADADAVVFRSSATAPASAAIAVDARRPAARTSPTPAVPRTPGWRAAALLVWAAGIVIALFQMLLACAALWRARRAARPSNYAALAGTLARDLGIRDNVHVLEIPSGMPMTFGVLRPTVFVPSSAAQWSEDRRRVVLLHELAHIRRGDAASHLIARVALAFNWWNPLAWSAWRAFLHERERAADDLVLASGAPAADYAEHLLEIARTLQLRPVTLAAGIPMARPSELEGRLHAILDSRTRRTQPTRAMGLIAATLAIALMAPLAAIRAQSKAEQDLPPDVDATIAIANQQKNREILDQAAVSYERLRKFDEARKLREASLALAEQTTGAHSSAYVIALIRLGDLARRAGSVTVAEAFYNQALAIGDRPEAFPALLRLALTSKVPETRREYLERARIVGKGNDSGIAMTWLAHDRQQDPDGATAADILYRDAIALESADSPELALTQELYAQFLQSNGREAEATAVLDRAKVIRRILVGSAISSKTITAGKVGPGITPPRLLYKLEPEYSEEARSLAFQGTVRLKVVVDVDGVARNIELLSGLGYGLDEKAAQAIALWKFKPAEKDGAPLPVQAVIEVNFKLM